MRRFLIVVFILVFAAFGVSGVQAATIDLFDWGFNIDGSTTLYGDSLPVSIDDSGFDWFTGLGTISIDVTGAGSHSVLGFFDHEIDETINTFFNESGSTSGGLAAGQSWEIDEPGYVFGDIYSNLLAGSLDNSNAVPSGWEDDVSMALGWDFSLLAGESGVIDFILNDTAGSGFNLIHTDPDSGAPNNIYFSSNLTISGGPDPIPEPGTLILLGSGLLGLAGFGRKRFLKKQ